MEPEDVVPIGPIAATAGFPEGRRAAKYRGERYYAPRGAWGAEAFGRGAWRTMG